VLRGTLLDRAIRERRPSVEPAPAPMPGTLPS
jgi:hypothetical protein